ncbi:type II toxin-antitoxin system RelE/ParE family toxin [Brevibacterium oceani]|uniref:type II toxin-antitoxin system RelE/ParE family toxin n=1 Tax=Brevibacterium oceani TaxID=358099 RepID=UPI002810F190|nr:type II toxin-antitoxin system RelE/ParE family toxin [Brevibacterium oceani]
MTLDDDSRNQVVAAIELLEEHGPNLGRQLVDTVVASRHKNMKELRPGSSGRSELRVLFAFDSQKESRTSHCGRQVRRLEPLVSKKHTGRGRSFRRTSA